MPIRGGPGQARRDGEPVRAAGRRWRSELGERLAQRGAEPLSAGRSAPRSSGGWRRRCGLPAGMALMLGNGSDELIHLRDPGLRQARRGGAVAVAELRDVRDERALRRLPLRRRAADARTSRSTARAMLAAIAEHRPAVIFIAWPNNPTGNLFDRATVEAVLDAAPRPGGARRGLPAVRAATPGCRS
ncbi:MAG: hypothetical protein MZW92_44680 [Comamonadaceae bacterium]|nr:hypothetical protein [Comamonadaceae bacterium]